MGLAITLGRSEMDRAAAFIWRNARLLERRSYLYSIGDGPRDGVLDALLAYQNADGGFGQALEPDKCCPHSQPVDVEFALRVMDSIGILPEQPVRAACDWLASVATAAGGVPFSLPTLNAYPHAPWWEAPERPDASVNPTAAIVGLLRKHGVEHLWLEGATRYCYDAIAAWEGAEYHSAMPVATFLQHAPDRSFAGAEMKRLKDRIVGTVEVDPDAEGYVHLPLDWAPRPDAPLRDVFGDALLGRHLEALRDKQDEDGGWSIPWPTVSEAATAEWRGIRTLGALETLRAWA